MIRQLLEQEIKKEVDAVSLHDVPEHKQRAICEAWPVAEQTLTEVSALVKNVIVRLVILTVIGLGKALVSKFCKPD